MFLQHVHMEARDQTRNRLRRRELYTEADLFGGCSVFIWYGRIGRTGRTIRRNFQDEVSARRYVRAAVSRRRSALRRIGVAYRTVKNKMENQIE